MPSTFLEHTLPNGLRVVCETMPNVRSTALGFLVRTGARHESEDQHGVSHFLEHMCFKGTPTRNSIDVNVRFDELGSLYNAFTGKEHTVYYGWVPAERMDEQLELLADMMRPTLPPEDYETERKVILEEIAMNDDAFDRHVANFVHKVVFENHSLAHEILGEKETIEKLSRDAMAEYHAKRYHPGNMVLVASGAVDANELFASAGRNCGHWAPPPRENGSATAPPAMKLDGVHRLVMDRFKQQSIIIGYPAPGYGTEWDEVIAAFCALFGGHNSRCYWNIVQKGICTSAGVSWLSYADCGMLAYYADGQPERCEEMLDALRREIERLLRGGVSAGEVERVRNQRRTQLALEGENPRTRFMQLVDDLEEHNATRTMSARLAEVDAVTPRRIADYFKAYPLRGDGLLVSCGPRDWP
jgi:predicted Zn-dependent peptidase